MITLELNRHYLNECTISTAVLMVDDNVKFVCNFFELPWRNNSKNISCIPAGSYNCKPYSSVRYNNVYQVDDVPNRGYILIHIGNFLKDTEGCLMPCMGFDFQKIPMGTSSTNAMNKLREIIGQNKFFLNIK